MILFPRWAFVSQLIALVILTQQASGAPASPTASGGVSYEIPLSDLKKMEQKKPKKSGVKTRKEKKKTEITEQKISQNDSAVSSPSVSGLARITHYPYSYLVPGKRTVIKAVISGQEIITSVRCQFVSAKGTGYAFVPMTKENGSQFTYSATLPGLAQGVKTLRYNIVVEDTTAKVTRSQEFVISVNPESVVPGWQHEPSKEPVKVGLENSGQPLDGFTDLIVETNFK